MNQRVSYIVGTLLGWGAGRLILDVDEVEHHGVEDDICVHQFAVGLGVGGDGDRHFFRVFHAKRPLEFAVGLDRGNDVAVISGVDIVREPAKHELHVRTVFSAPYVKARVNQLLGGTVCQEAAAVVDEIRQASGVPHLRGGGGHKTALSLDFARRAALEGETDSGIGGDEQQGQDRPGAASHGPRPSGSQPTPNFWV